MRPPGNRRPGADPASPVTVSRDAGVQPERGVCLRGQARWTADSLDDSDRECLAIGADSGPKMEQGFVGKIDEVQLYRRGLNEDEVKFLFENPDKAAMVRPGSEDRE